MQKSRRWLIIDLTSQVKYLYFRVFGLTILLCSFLNVVSSMDLACPPGDQWGITRNDLQREKVTVKTVSGGILRRFRAVWVSENWQSNKNKRLQLRRRHSGRIGSLRLPRSVHSLPVRGKRGVMKYQMAELDCSTYTVHRLFCSTNYYSGLN